MQRQHLQLDMVLLNLTVFGTGFKAGPLQTNVFSMLPTSRVQPLCDGELGQSAERKQRCPTVVTLMQHLLYWAT